MNILLNGKNKNIQDSISITELIQDLNLTERKYVIEINEEIIPKSKHALYRVNENDKVEIIRAVGGG